MTKFPRGYQHQSEHPDDPSGENQNHRARFGHRGPSAVSDQPGLTISAIGVCLSLFFSFLFLGYFSNDRITKELNQATQHIDPKLKLNFEQAILSLRDGFLPRFSVLIKNVDLKFLDHCFLYPHLIVDEVELPISIGSLFRGQNPVRSIKLYESQMILDSEQRFCNQFQFDPKKEQGARADGSTARPVPAAGVQVESQTSKTDFSEQVRNVTIERLRIVTQLHPESLLEVQDLDFDLVSADPKHINLVSKVNLFKEKAVQDFFSRGDLEADYREYPEKHLNVKVVGHVREGSYHVQLGVNFAKNEFEITSDFQHVPFTPFLELLQRTKVTNLDLPVKKIWTSFGAEGKGYFHDLKNAYLQIKPFSVEGSFGFIKSDQIRFKNFEDPEFEPFRISLQKIQLDEILQQIPRFKSYQFINQYGTFQGQIEYQGPRDLRVTGLHTNLELIFSNLGQREVQKVKNILMDARYDQGVWKVKIPRADLESGVFDGEVSVEIQPKTHALEVKSSIDEIQFSPEVQSIMTNGGTFGIANLNFHGKWINDQLVQENGQFAVQFLDLYGIKTGKLKGVLTRDNDFHQLHLKLGNLDIDPTSEVGAKLEPLFSGLSKKGGDYKVKDLSAVFEIKSFQNVQWKNVVAKSEQGVFHIQGLWDESQKLSGTILLRTPKKDLNWNISGFRGAPEIAP